MMGEWSIAVMDMVEDGKMTYPKGILFAEMLEKEGAVEHSGTVAWSGSLRVLEGTAQHVEGARTCVLQKFEAKGGNWSATVVFDENKGPDDWWRLNGSYKADSAQCMVEHTSLQGKPEPASPGFISLQQWTLTKTGETQQ